MNNERRAIRNLVLLAAACVVVAMSACNTVSGVGKDIQEVSDNVKNAIEN